MHENRGRVTRASEKVIWHESKMQHLRTAIAARPPFLGLRRPDYVNSVLKCLFFGLDEPRFVLMGISPRGVCVR